MYVITNVIICGQYRIISTDDLNFFNVCICEPSDSNSLPEIKDDIDILLIRSQNTFQIHCSINAVNNIVFASQGFPA